MPTRRRRKSDDVANQIQVSKSLIYKLVHTGQIPHMKIGTLVRFHPGSIDRWINRKIRKGIPHQPLLEI
ncbi:MAG: helix-turn-helix domain-containing protein [Candidatus Omnitrophica bacterium]|nr:helix-turn-helix domain-containing protein [Candidatus Omnitrophota bacterium]